MKDSLEKIYSIEKNFKVIEKYYGLPSFSSREKGYMALQKTIVGQQLSIASANAIWGRFVSSGFTKTEKFKVTNDIDFKSIGLSKQKISYLRSLADGEINYEKLNYMSNAEVISLLTSIKGIGAWTAEIYLIFSLQRLDVFPAGDLALQEATRILFKINARPSEKEMRELSEKWSPLRSVCSLLLWHLYKNNKSQESKLW